MIATISHSGKGKTIELVKKISGMSKYFNRRTFKFCKYQCMAYFYLCFVFIISFS